MTNKACIVCSAKTKTYLDYKGVNGEVWLCKDEKACVTRKVKQLENRAKIFTEAEPPLSSGKRDQKRRFD